MLVGMFGPTLAIDHWYFEPLCQRYAAVQEAVQWWSYAGGSSKLSKKRCTADGKSATVAELGGTTAIILAKVHDLIQPFGMVLGLIGGALLWQRISALLDWLIIAGTKIPNGIIEMIKRQIQ
jgi:hypothetical protein